MKLSIIIPYYETYELTDTLLKGLIPQLTEETELILIDDGCNETRLDKYKKDIILIHQKDNLGQRTTRNNAIAIAKGKYLAFVDSDDMCTPDYVETLINAIDKYDADVINFNWLDLTTNEVYRKPTNPAFWKAIYKANKLLKFREDVPSGQEDFFFQEELEVEVNSGRYSIAYLDKVLYLYNSNRVGSLTWKVFHKEEEQ